MHICIAHHAYCPHYMRIYYVHMTCTGTCMCMCMLPRILSHYMPHILPTLHATYTYAYIATYIVTCTCFTCACIILPTLRGQWQVVKRCMYTALHDPCLMRRGCTVSANCAAFEFRLSVKLDPSALYMRTSSPHCVYKASVLREARQKDRERGVRARLKAAK